MSEFTSANSITADVSSLSINDEVVSSVTSTTGVPAHAAVPAKAEDPCDDEGEGEGDDEEDGEGDGEVGADGAAAGGGKKRRKKKSNKKKKKSGASAASTGGAVGTRGVDGARILQALNVEPCAPLSRLIGGNTKYYCALGQTEIPSIPVHTVACIWQQRISLYIYICNIIT
jgi:hypothetical protein